MSATVEYCIIGAGPAGLNVAASLARAGKEVLVLEQGPSYDMTVRPGLIERGNQEIRWADFNDDLTPRAQNAVESHGEDANLRSAGKQVKWYYYRLAGVGGTSLHWYANCPRPVEDDLRTFSKHGFARDWPFSYQDFEPWLLRAEHEIGVSASQDNPYVAHRSGPFPMPAHAFSYFDRTFFGPAARKLGWTAHSVPWGINSVPRQERPACAGCRRCYFCPSGARYSADQVHGRMLVGYPNVRIQSGVHVRRLETSSTGPSRVTAVHAEHVGDAKPLVFQARYVILAAGAIETTRLLLVSADGRQPRGLGNQGGQLGRGFADHLMSMFAFKMKQPTGQRLGFPTMGCDHFRALASRAEHPSFHFLVEPFLDDDTPEAGQWLASWSTEGERLSLASLRKTVSQAAYGWMQAEMSGSGTVELSPDAKDAYGDPASRISMQLTDHDLAAVRTLNTQLGRLAEALDADAYDLTDAVYFASHPMGSTAMAARPDAGVCDSNLRVFGVENLYLASGSCIPHIGSANPTLSIVALSLRLAAHLGGK
jgi:choline dehydrogenase-like flavoprotein